VKAAERAAITVTVLVVLFEPALFVTVRVAVFDPVVA
jgi:hypothetical protein